MNPRKILLLLLVLAVTGGVVLLSSAPERAPPGQRSVAQPGAADGGADRSAAQGTVGSGGALPGSAGMAASTTQREPFTKATQCRTCHEAVYAEWLESFHGRAWTDPMVQALSQGFRMSECVDCHAPMPIHVTGVGQRVAPRQHSRGDGVDCLTCHLLDDGVSVASTRAADTSKVAGACRPVAVKEMAEPTACAGCHNQHQTLDELAGSGVKETCAACHMPQVPRGAAGSGMGGSDLMGRSHRFPGAHSLEMHRKAVALDLSVDGGAVVAKVTNAGAGHHVPTDARHRSYNLFLSAWDERGNPLVVDRPMEKGEFRLYYRDDFRPSTQIAFGKTGEGRWPIPEGIRGKVKVRLAYALNPEELAAKRLLDVWEKEIAFP